MKAVLIGVLAVGVLVCGGGSSHATPFVFGNEVCGTLNKTRTNDGTAAWKVVGCPQLERLVACGNGVLEEYEVCDRALEGSCPRGKVCVACEACVRSAGGTNPVPTPTPNPPTPIPPTPTPPASCPQGELPPLGIPGFPGYLGYDHVSIADGETHTYCVSVGGGARFVRLEVADRTGAAQCSWFTVTLTPPPGSGHSARTSVGLGVSLIDLATPIPQGTWLVSVTAAVIPGCAQRYLIAASFN